MSPRARYKPEFESLKHLMLEIAQERSTSQLLQRIVDRLNERDHVALARVWLVAPGDQCETCLKRELCARHVDCLHLVSLAGSPMDPAESWSLKDAPFQRFPIGVSKLGHIAQTGKNLDLYDLNEDAAWISDPEWVRKEGIVGFTGEAIVYRGEVLGVLDMFLRTNPLAEGTVWLRMIADHAAAAIVNARAFEELERLRQQLQRENAYLRQEVREAHLFGDMLGMSDGFKQIEQKVELVAPTDASVLILGESGTGKELVAHEIHRRSARADKPLVRVNCGSIPAELFESEFFGHVKGAFTGAVRDREGRFALADGGTLFLDEVGEIPLDLQSKLLRVLQEGTYERVGEERTRTVDVRIIAATNRDLEQAVEDGRFRQDLYYRLNVFPISVPALRERPEDVPLLAAHFLKESAARLHREVPPLTETLARRLRGYSWPGNVRELQNVIERAVITCAGRRLEVDLPTGGHGAAPEPAGPEAQPERVLTEAELRDLERENLRRALEQCGWKVYGPGGAADLLGLRPTTLTSRMRKMGLEKPDE